jgi:hypothetical protein
MYPYFTFNDNDFPAYLANVCAKGADGSGVGTDPLAVINDKLTRTLFTAFEH